MRYKALPLILLLLLASVGFGWSTKEHMQFARVAAIRLEAQADLPPAFRQWLKEAAPDALSMETERDYLLHKRVGAIARGADGLSFWATMPDVTAATDHRDLAPYGVPERLLHFTDLEHFNAQPEHRRYSDDLSGLPALKDIPRDLHDPRYRTAGFLPFRVQECQDRSIELFRQGKLLDHPGQLPRDEHAVKWMGMLAHYAADSTQPQHATEDYKSLSYLAPSLHKLANPHEDFEYRLVDDDGDDYPALREEYWKLYVSALEKLEKIDAGPLPQDAWESTVATLRQSYLCLPLIGRAAAAAYTLTPSGKARFDAEAFFHFRGEVAGRAMTLLEMKAQQTALATRRIEKLWRQAWEAAHPPKLPGAR